MANIIEKEIAIRETLIVDKKTKEEKAIQLQMEAEQLITEAAAIDETTLLAEIKELTTYLPKEEVEADSTELGLNHEPFLTNPTVPFI